MKLVHEQGQPGAGDTAVLRELARASTLEATPGQILGSHAWAASLPDGMAVYVPFLPNAEFDDTLAACRRLCEAGMRPVPHVPARAVRSVAQLHDWLSRLTESGTDRLLLIAGDSARPGPFVDTLAVLESGLLADHGIRDLGIAGHPEGHPVASKQELDRAVEIKREYAIATRTRMWIVTQFAFEAEVITRWLTALDDATNPLPVYLGMAGPTRLRTLIAYAAQCGVGVSAGVLRRKPGAARLLRHWTPDGLAQALASYRAGRPRSSLRGFHLFPFGGLERSAEWLQTLGSEPQECADPSSQSGA